jgi:hypothetical protein
VTAPGVEYWSGQRFGWRYLAFTMDGSGGSQAMLSGELPLLDVSFTDVLSGPPQFSATINPLFRQLLGTDSQPLLRPWHCQILAEQDGVLRYGGVLISAPSIGPTLSLDCSGFSGYAKGMPYEGDTQWIESDPLDLTRHIWAHIQGGDESNLGMVVDTATNTGGAVRLGKALVPDVNGVLPTNSSGDEGPYKLNWYSNDDLGGDIDDLAAQTPFDYHERHQWDSTKTQPKHYLDFGYPRLGQRQGDLRFVLGENIQTLPNIEADGEEYASHVRVLGAGEGSAMTKGEARQWTGGLRRAVTIDRKDVADASRAQSIARRELHSRLLLTNTPQVLVRNTPSAPIGSFGVGDEIRVQVTEDWRSVDLWFRVLSSTIRPQDPELMALDLIRSDLVG